MYNKAFQITSSERRVTHSPPFEDDGGNTNGDNDYQKHAQEFRNMIFRKVQREQTDINGQIKDLNERVRLSEGVQAMEIEEKVSFWDVLRGLYIDVEIFQMVLSILTAIFYIITTYIQLSFGERMAAIIVLDLMFSFIFSCFFWTNFVMAKNKKLFFFHPLSILDYITIIPALVINLFALIPGGWESVADIYTFVSVLRVLRLLRIIPHIKKIAQGGGVNSVYVKVADLGLTVACLMVIFTGIFQWLENYFMDRGIYFHDAFYFMGITLFTIGYGDISPSHWTSRLMVLVFFLIGVSLIPLQISQIYDIVTSDRTLFRVKNSTISKHSIITGNCRLDEVIDFIKECFQYKSRNGSKIVLLFKDKKFCEDLSENLKAFSFLNKLHVLCGEIMDFEVMSLLRVGEAHSVFLLNSPKSEDPKQQDTNVIMTTISLKNFNPRLKVYAQINLIESRSLIQKAGAKVIVCYESICSKVMSACSASSVFAPFLYNLLSGADVKIDYRKTKNYRFSKKISPEENDIGWIIEYAEGLSCEIYKVHFSPVFIGYLFIDVAELLRRSAVIIFAIESNGFIFINPAKYKIKEGDKCFCIAPSIKYAEIVEKYVIAQKDLENIKSNKVELERIDYGWGKQDNTDSMAFESHFVDFLRQNETVEKEEPKKKPRKLKLKPVDNTKKLLKARTERVVDIQLLRPKEEDEKTHLEILLKLIAPEKYFREKRHYLETIRKLYNGDQLSERENAFYERLCENYNVLEHERSHEEFFISSYRDIDLKNHLIILGDFRQPEIICSLTRSLQRHYRSVPILFLSEGSDQQVETMYNRLKKFNLVYLMRGSLLNHSDLSKAGFEVSQSVLYFTTEEVDSSTNSYNEYRVDADAIKLSLEFSVINKTKNYVIVKLEIVNRANMKFFQHQGIPTHLKVKKLMRDHVVDYDLDEFDQFCLFSDYYISGKIFPSSTFLSKLLAQSYHNKRIVDIVDQLCSDEFSAGDHQSVMIEIPLPSVFSNQSVLSLMTVCYDYNLILMALSRVKTNRTDERYIYTNPSLKCILKDTDVLFLLGHRHDVKSMLFDKKCNDKFFEKSWTSKLLPTIPNSSPRSSSSDPPPVPASNQTKVEELERNGTVTSMQVERFHYGDIDSDSDSSKDEVEEV